MRIGITCDLKPVSAAKDTGPDDRFEEFDDPSTVEAIASVLRQRGHQVETLGDGPELLRRLLADPPDFVFNFAEGHGISRNREARVPAVLEMLGIPYSGSDPLTLAVTLDKHCAKKLVDGCPELHVPRGALATPGTKLTSSTLPPFPVIAKPAWEGSSKGIRSVSLIRSREELPAVVASLAKDHQQPVLIEEFIDGDELTVGVVGNDPPRVVGVMRVVPLQQKPGQPFFYSLEVKRDWQRQVRYELAKYSPEQLTKIETAALGAYRALGCRDVSRIDFRFDHQRGLFFLEVNPLPGLNPETGDLVILSRLAGWSYDRLIGTIFDAALKRQGAGPCAS